MDRDLRAQVRDQSHSRILADGADAGHRSLLVGKGSGDGHHVSVRGFESESEAASIILIDQLFQDIHTLHRKDRITSEDIAGTWVLSGLPPQYAERYNGLFAQRFLVVAADTAAKLPAGWTYPSCVAQELAVRCLLDQIEVTADTHELDLDPNWRGILTDRILEDTDSDMLFDRSFDGFQHDERLNEQLRLAPMALEHWFEPFSERHVPPYAR